MSVTPVPMRRPALSGAAAASKQRAEQASTDLGPMPRLEWLPLDSLSVDRRYQRSMGADNWAHANRILREFCWLHYQPICVAPAKAGYVVIDGQHRLEAARKHPLIERLPCYIVEAPDVAQQAAAFVAFNGRRIGITRLQRFWASHAGGDRTALRIHALCARAGVSITRSGGLLPPRTLNATFTLEKLLPLGEESIVAALRAIGDAHGTTYDAFKSGLIVALTRLIYAEGKAYRHLPLVRVLRGLDLGEEIARARRHRAENGGRLEASLQVLLGERYRKRDAA